MKKGVQKKNLKKVVGGGGEDSFSAIILAFRFKDCWIPHRNVKEAMRILNEARRLKPSAYNLFKELVNKMTGIDVDKLYPPKIN